MSQPIKAVDVAFDVDIAVVLIVVVVFVIVVVVVMVVVDPRNLPSKSCQNQVHNS